MLGPQDFESMMQVEESSDGQDCFVICQIAPRHVKYPQLFHDEFRSDPEFCNRQLTFRGMPDPDNPGRTRVRMTIKGTAPEAKLIVEHLTGGKPM